MGIKRVAGLAWNRLLMRVDNSTGKGTSGMWTNLAAKFTECTWSLEASFLTLWESRPSFLKGGGYVGGEYPCKRVFDFSVRMFRQRCLYVQWSLSRNWVLILKELGSFPPSSMCTLWTSLLNLSIYTRRALSSTVINSHQEPVSGQACISPDPHWFFLSFPRWRSSTVLGTKVASFS